MEAAGGEQLAAALGGIGIIVYILGVIVLGLVWLIVAIWVGFDAAGKRQPGLPWFLLTAMFFPLGLTAWLVVRGFLPSSVE